MTLNRYTLKLPKEAFSTLHLGALYHQATVPVVFTAFFSRVLALALSPGPLGAWVEATFLRAHALS